ncbi:MFS transporter [Advenella sp. S44]|uniref:MFS transporter n=1 Tax=Advenella sp. S44 TaxID=1982755 RepID=UPI000C29DE6B|nr:MFS transporter [Advenella sp. S44]PJX20353.1 MFS transporter [Advenella sp. S44]
MDEARYPVQSALAVGSLLTLAMGMPMMIFYGIGVLGPQLIQELGISRGQLAWLTTASFGVAAVVSPWSGQAVQRLGMRSGLMGLFGLVALSFFLMAVLPGFVGLILAMLLCGAAQSLANPATNMAIAKLVPAPKKPAMVGIKQSGVQISALVAGILLPFFAQWLGWRGALALWVPLALVMFFLVSRRLPAGMASAQPLAGGRALALPRPNVLLGLLMLVQLCAGLTLSSFITFFGVYASQLGMSAQMTGAMISVFGVMGIVSRIALTPLGSRLRDETQLMVMLFILACLAVYVTTLATPTRHFPLWIGITGMGLTVAATNAIAMSMLLRDERFGKTATAAGMLSVGFFGGFAVGPLLFGVLLSQPQGFGIAWFLLIGTTLAGAAFSLMLYRIRSHGST